MMFLKRLSLPGLACGLILTAGASAQVVEERPVTQTDRPVVVDDDTAVLTDADRTQTDGENAIRRVSEILSGEARGPGDEGRIAAISDLIMDAEGKPHYVMLSQGGVAGVGGDVIAVPVNAGQLIYVEDGGWHFQLPMTGEQLEQAPTLERGSLTELRDPNWVRANHEYFETDAADDPAGTGEESFLYRASALKDAQVRGNVNDESIANVDDVLLDAEHRASYAILGYGGVAGLGKNQIPVPFNMLRLTSEVEDDRYRLIVGIDTTKERLQSDTAPTLDGEYNRMLDPTFTERVHTYFGTERAADASGTTGATGTDTPPERP